MAKRQTKQPLKLNPFQQFVADRVRNRGGENWGSGAVAMAALHNLERTFIRDIVEGKKASVRPGANLVRLADALGVDHILLLDLMARKQSAIDKARGLIEEERTEIAAIHGPAEYTRIPLIEWNPEDPETVDEENSAYSIEHYRPKISGALPEIDVRVGAGQGTVGDIVALPMGGDSISGHRVIAEWVFPDGFLRNEARVSPNHTLVMPVVGDSMIPTYMPGDRVLVDLLQNRMTTDTVYVISDGHSDPQIKRLQRVMFSEPARVRIISDNPALETDTVDLDRVQIIGRVCGHIARK